MLANPIFEAKFSKLAQQYFPVHGAIEVTNRCNAGCGYCFIEERNASRELTTSELYFVIEKLARSGLMHLTITGGEPFLRNDINNILEHCFNESFFITSIYSNGTLVDNRHIDLMGRYRKHILLFRMTVFSHHEALHDAYMKLPGSLKTIITTGLRLIDKGVNVQLALPYMDFNYHELFETMNYFKNLGFSVGTNPTKVINDKNDSPEIRAMISEEFYRKVLASNPSGELYAAEENCDNLCRGLRESLMIDIHGDIHPCITFRNVVIGSIFDTSPLDEILGRSEQYRQLRQLTKKDLPCDACEYRAVCNPCMALWHTMSGSYRHPNPQNCNKCKAYASLGRMR